MLFHPGSSFSILSHTADSLKLEENGSANFLEIGDCDDSFLPFEHHHPVIHADHTARFVPDFLEVTVHSQCQLVKIFENRINGLNIRNKVSFWNDSWSKWRG